MCVFVPFPLAGGSMGRRGEVAGDGGSSLTRDRSGKRLISMPTTLSGDEDGTKLSGVSLSVQ